MKKISIVGVFIGLIMISTMLFRHPYKVIDASKSDDYYYTFLKKEIHHVPMGNWFELGDTRLDVEVKNFKVLSQNYAKDNKNVFYKDILIRNADAATFEFIKASYGYNFAKDKNNLYVGSNHFKDLDILTYKIVQENDTLMVKDSKHTYLLTSDDADQYECINCIDRTLSRTNGNWEIPFLIDPESFQVLNEAYSKDSVTAYYKNEPIAGSNSNSFVSLNAYYAKDDFCAYFKGKPIEGADAKTFELTNGDEVNFDDKDLFARDINKVYFEGLVFSGPDAPSFELMAGDYFKDKNNIYFGIEFIFDKKTHRPTSVFPQTIVKDADLRTFEVIDDGKNYEAKDANHLYKSGIVQ